MCAQAVAQALGKTPAVIKTEYEKSGDLGQVAVSSRSTQQTLFKAKGLTLRGVFSSFQSIAKSHGDKSQDKKRDIIVKLLAGSKTSEAGYIIRSLQVLHNPCEGLAWFTHFDIFLTRR